MLLILCKIYMQGFYIHSYSSSWRHDIACLDSALSNRVVLPCSESGKGRCSTQWEGQGEVLFPNLNSRAEKTSKEF